MNSYAAKRKRHWIKIFAVYFMNTNSSQNDLIVSLAWCNTISSICEKLLVNLTATDLKPSALTVLESPTKGEFVTGTNTFKHNIGASVGQVYNDILQIELVKLLGFFTWITRAFPFAFHSYFCTASTARVWVSLAINPAHWTVVGCTDTVASRFIAR